MKGLLLGILFVIIVGVGGLVYRNAVEHPLKQIECPLDAMVCPDGTSISRTGTSCSFEVCPAPNVTLSDIGISFAVPAGFTTAELPDATSIASYEMNSSSADVTSTITIRRFAIIASSTALATIQQTAIGGASGAPVSVTSFTSTVLGNHRFTIVSIERFEGVVDTAYYLARQNDVLRFDALDKGVSNWTETNLTVSTLPAHAALIRLLTTLQGQ